jgi:hypothetical protein
LPWIGQKKRATNEAHRTQAHDQPSHTASHTPVVRWILGRTFSVRRMVILKGLAACSRPAPSRPSPVQSVASRRSRACHWMRVKCAITARSVGRCSSPNPAIAASTAHMDRCLARRSSRNERAARA